MKYLLLIGGIIAIWLLLRNRKSSPAPGMPVAEARRVLAVSPGADAATIQEAHRRLIQRVHPDAGGTEELARRVNLAREALLAELEQSGRIPPR